MASVIHSNRIVRSQHTYCTRLCFQLYRVFLTPYRYLRQGLEFLKESGSILRKELFAAALAVEFIKNNIPNLCIPEINLRRWPAGAISSNRSPKVIFYAFFINIAYTKRFHISSDPLSAGRYSLPPKVVTYSIGR